MNLYEILQNPDRVGEGMTHFERLFAQKVGGGKINEISGVPPLRYIGDGRPLTDYLISGNALQDGTPTPDAPVEVQGCGVRTGNLFDFEQLKNAPSGTIEGANFSHLLELQLKANTYYTMASNGTGSTVSTPADLYRSVYFNSKTGEASVNKNHPVTALTDSTGIVRIGFASERTNAQQYLNGEAQLWINEGNTALPYEPYGYKLPLTVNGTEYPIYLGQVETTRRIKKLVLTGEEPWYTAVSSSGLFGIQRFEPMQAHPFIPSYSAISNFYVYNPVQSGVDAATASGEFAMQAFRVGSAWQYNFFIKDNRYGNVTDFKSYLAAQYAAGTPVTVWYVLAEPETAVVNEPLMKIGDYADTVSAAQAGVTIPTVRGENVLDVPTEVKPSEVWIQGKIKEV